MNFRIIRLYNFDNDLRIFVFRAINIIEVMLRTAITDIMSMSHGVSWYKNPELFNQKTDKTTAIEKIVNESGTSEQKVEINISRYVLIMKSVNKSLEVLENTEFLRAFKNKYSDDSPLPSWMIMECISFGTLSKLFSIILKSEEKQLIAKRFGALNPDFLGSWVHSLVVLRNLCAHHSRLWNKNIGKDVKMPTRPKKKFINSNDPRNLRKIYGISSCIMKIFDSTDKDKKIWFKTELIELTNKYDIDMNSMGFPTDWVSDEIWS